MRSSVSQLLRRYERRVCLLPCCFAALLLSACLGLPGCGNGGGTIQGNNTSGVRGTVTRLSASGSGAPMPAANVTVVLQKTLISGTSSNGGSVGYGPPLEQTQTDAQGNYSFVLVPGSNYAVGVLAASSQYFSGVHATVTVLANQFVNVDLQLPASF